MISVSCKWRMIYNEIRLPYRLHTQMNNVKHYKDRLMKIKKDMQTIYQRSKVLKVRRQCEKKTKKQSLLYSIKP